MFAFRLLRFGATIVLLIVVAGCESVPTIGDYVTPVSNASISNVSISNVPISNVPVSQKSVPSTDSYVAAVTHASGATLNVENLCEEGTQRCIITAMFHPNNRFDDTYTFMIRGSHCIKLANEKGKPLHSPNQVDIFLEATLSRQFSVHIYPHPDSDLPTQCMTSVIVTGSRAEATGDQFFMEDHVVVHTYKDDKTGGVVFGKDGNIPPYSQMTQNGGVINVRGTFKDNILHLGVGKQNVHEEIKVTLGEGVQFALDAERVGVRRNDSQSVTIASTILERVPEYGHKIVSLPIELAGDVVGAADTRCGDYPIKVSYPHREPERFPIKLVVSGCAGSTEDVLTIWSKLDQ